MYRVLNILEDVNGKTVGATLLDEDTNKVYRYSTLQLRGLASSMIVRNAIITKDGFVRSKQNSANLKRVVMAKQQNAVVQGEIQSASRLSGLVTVYHGSKSDNLVPVFGKGRKDNDYGRGFYTTPSKELGKEWAWSGYTSGDRAYVYAYEIDLNGLRVLDLTTYDSIHWIAELLSNRRLNVTGTIDTAVVEDNVRELIKKYKLNTNDYDVIIGYRADDSYFQYAESFVNGRMYKGDLDKALRFGGLGIQLFIKSRRAFNALRCISCEEVPLSYKDKFMRRDGAARREFNSLRSSKSVTTEKKTIYDFIK